MCSKCFGGKATHHNFIEPNGTITFRRCQCGLLHVRHYDGYWYTSENGYNLLEQLERCEKLNTEKKND